MLKFDLINQSVTGRTLFYIIAGLFFILLGTSALNYSMTRSEVEKSLRIQMLDQIQRIGSSQQEYLLLGGDITSAIRDIALKELSSTPKYDVQKRYHRLYMRYPDGAIRNRPEFGDGSLFSTLWAPAKTKDDAAFQRLFVLFYDLCQEYGPVIRTRFLNLYFVTRSGANVAFDPETPNWVYDAPADYDPSDQNWVSYGLPENNPMRKPMVTPPEHDPIPNLDVVSIVTPLDINGAYVGSVGFTVRYDDLIKQFGKSIIPNSTQILFRADGVLLAHSDHRQEILAAGGKLGIRDLHDSKLNLVYQIAANAAEAPLVDYDAQNEFYYAITRLKGTDWYTANLVPASAVNNTAARATQWVLWSSLLLLMLLIVLLHGVLNRQIAYPLKKLASSANQIAAGNFNTRLWATREDEVGSLTNALNDMSKQLQHREQANQEEKAELAIALDSTRATENRFRALLEYAADVIMVLDEKGIIRFIAPSVERETGYSANEWEGKPSVINLHPDDQALAARNINRILKHPGEVVTNLEFRIRNKGNQWQYYSVTFTNQLDNPSVQGIVVNAHNIDEKKRHEQEMQKQKEALYQSDKLSSMGSLLAGVAHELNNPLSVVVGWAMMLESETTDEYSQNALEKLRNAAERCARIVKTFLAMAKHTKPKLEICNINDIIFLALDITSYILRTTGVEIEKDFDDALPDIFADPDQLHQVFVNLIINAQQALSGSSGERKIRLVTNYDSQTKSVNAFIYDSGPGIADNLNEKIFSPFFTTKPSGTGIGLSVSRSLVESNNGRLELTSALLSGAAFKLSFPVSVESLAPDEQKLVEDNASNDHLNILVVDDEEDVREVISNILLMHGHNVHPASNVNNALHLIETRNIDLIITDMRMPGLDGQALYRILGNTVPEMLQRVIFITGDTLSNDIELFLKECACPYLEKPIHPEDLYKTIHRLFHENSQEPA